MRRLLLLGFLAACNDDTDVVDTDTDVVDTDPVDTDTDEDTDPVDTDTDPVDTDTDVVDTDTDVVDPGPQWDGLFGTVTFQRRRGDELECDFDVDIQAFTPYTGSCSGCDFAFNLQSGVVREDSTPYCALETADYVRAFLSDPDGLIYDRWIAYTPGFTLTDTYMGEPRERSWSNMLYAGYQYGNADAITGTYSVSYSYYGYPYEWTDSASEDGEGTVTLDGTALNFEWADSFTDWASDNYSAWCWTGLGDEREAAVTEGDWADGTLPCDADVLDAWTFEAENAATVAIAVDTTDGNAFADLKFSLLDPSWCRVTSQDDSFLCSAQDGGSERAWCPAWEGEVEESGEYTLTVEVGGYGCAGDATEAAYRVWVQGATPGTLLQKRDSYDASGSVTISTVVHGALELVPAE